MPDYYVGYWDEGRLRGTQNVAPAPSPVNVNTRYSGTVGGNRVDIYGPGAAMTQDQATQHLLGQEGTRLQMRTGSMPVAQWQALNPNATPAELSAYRRLNAEYTASTSMGSVGQSLGNAADFELDHIGNILEGLADEPGRLVFGFDPIGTEIGNAVTGRNYDPLVNQMGGATSQQIRDYEARNGFNSAGAAQNLHDAAAGTAAVITAGTLANGGLSGGGGGAGSGGGFGGGYGGGGGISPAQTLGLPAAEAGGAAAGAAGAALPEVVVTGYTPWLTAGELGAIGGGVAAGGAVAAGSGGPAPTNYGEYGGWQTNADPAGSVGGGIGSGGNAGDLVLQGGAGTIGGGNMGWMDWVGPLISAGSSIYGSRQAGNAIEAGSREAIAENRRQFDLVRADTAGQRALGDAAIKTIGGLYGYDDGTPDMSRFFTSPDYQFNLAEDQKAIDRSLAARGGALSGAGVREGVRYASGLASREYSAYVDRLLQQAGVGATGIGASAAAGANAAGNIGQYATNAGNNRASIYMDNAANVNNAAQAGMSNYTLRRYLDG